jgi:cytoskeletal protein CcmA (bactofilin family)
MESPTGIGPSIQITGTISAQEPLTIAGHVTGTIDVSGHALTMTSTARVDGDIAADRIMISGKAHGRLLATSRIAVDDTATIEGTLQTPVLSVAVGAAIQGDFAVDGRRAAALPLAN